MKKLEVKMMNELKKAEEIARKIELLFEQDLKIEDVKKESKETTLARIEKITRDIEKSTGYKIDIEKAKREAAEEVKKLTGYRIDMDKVEKETADETLARLERVAERIKEWKEVP